LLSDEAWIYLEDAADHEPPQLPENWSYYREKKAGQVCYRLARRQAKT
ncbi:MAG: 16S rRNA (guanine(966)-N(2))-methyltransferase RsmD, partial [Gammaproteobacteria bacterium]|nr:16S rRNA (guanine(966)-N(2))-methyltransferase RsmD [Gammaproteobacteria bacterium]